MMSIPRGAASMICVAHQAPPSPGSASRASTYKQVSKQVSK